MKFFFDTSALVKFFYVETGTEFVTQIMEHAASEIWISDLARLEFTSALYRRYRNKSLTVLAEVAKQAGFLSLNPQQITDTDLNSWITSNA